MAAFELLTMTPVTLKSLTPRTEKHGDEDVFAITLGVKTTTANTMLDLLDPKLRTALYTAVEGQDQLPGVEPSTPLLRTRNIETLSLKSCFEGWTLNVDHGVDENDPIQLGGCKVDGFKVSPKEGGSVELSFRIGSNDIDAAEAGLLCSKLSQEIHITLVAPAKSEGTIDGTTAAFQADHPDADATDLFVGQHADRGDNEGSPRTSDDADSEGGETDAGTGDGLAEFEAGATAAVESAGLKPKRRGPAANDSKRSKAA